MKKAFKKTENETERESFFIEERLTFQFCFILQQRTWRCLKLRLGYLYSCLAISFSLRFAHHRMQQKKCTRFSNKIKKKTRRKTVANYDEKEEQKFRDWENALMFAMCIFSSSKHIIMMWTHHVSQNDFSPRFLLKCSTILTSDWSLWTPERFHEIHKVERFHFSCWCLENARNFINLISV